MLQEVNLLAADDSGSGGGVYSMEELGRAVASLWPELDHKLGLGFAYKAARLNADGPSFSPKTLPFASRSVRRALLTPQVNPGSLYRCGQRC